MTTTATTLNRSKAPPSLEGFSWTPLSALSPTPRGLTRTRSTSEKPRLIELAGSCFTLVPSLVPSPFSQAAEHDCLFTFHNTSVAVRRPRSGGGGGGGRATVSRDFTTQFCEGRRGLAELGQEHGPGAPSRLTDFLYKCKCGDGKTTGECQKARVVRPEHSLDLRYGQHREPDARGQGAARGPRAPLLNGVNIKS